MVLLILLTFSHTQIYACYTILHSTFQNKVSHGEEMQNCFRRQIHSTSISVKQTIWRTFVIFSFLYIICRTSIYTRISVLIWFPIVLKYITLQNYFIFVLQTLTHVSCLKYLVGLFCAFFSKGKWKQGKNKPRSI